MTNLDNDYLQFIQLFKKKTGIDLSAYKEAQMKRRLTSLRNKRGFDSFNEYFQAINKDEKLYYELLDRMTINVSEFFRNSGRWHVLGEKIIPLLINSKPLKLWSAACSTGEEPYSLTMLMKHQFPHVNFDLVATDIDDGAIKKAKEGIYGEKAIAEVPKPILSKYFMVKESLYHVLPEIKNKVVYRKHNLLSDQFEPNLDLIICRNVMIYFTEEAKHELYQKFSDALKPGGILFVGSTEQIFNPRQYNLEAIDTFFYRKNSSL